MYSFHMYSFDMYSFHTLYILVKYIGLKYYDNNKIVTDCTCTSIVLIKILQGNNYIIT